MKSASILKLHLLSFRLQATLERLAAKLESVYKASGGKKINIISHSMRGLLVKCFMGLHSDVHLDILLLPSLMECHLLKGFTLKEQETSLQLIGIEQSKFRIK
ncbi:hypothetical protein E1A91_D10G151300v1 [Gossypium mustelinum]|uniref:DUF676 domain-containing protein n=1 Tax=Gossypium mustelinum TaxID=34275 RepID=A0A5D2T754_GOSMU|nr:hypothetical protein E1A91_D10G151300v1 [Gossypium mustelinum]